MRRLQNRHAVPEWALLVCVVIACFFCVGAADEEAIQLNDRLNVLLDQGARTFSFSAARDGEYTFSSFGGQDVEAQLHAEPGGRIVAQGSGFHFSARLTAGSAYKLTVRGRSGTAAVEMMRVAPGHSFYQPQTLSVLEEGYSQVLVHPYDVHWYRFVPRESGDYLISTRSDPNMNGLLTDEYGRALMVSGAGTAGDFWMQAKLTANRTYLLRVSANGDAAGRYHLSFSYAYPGAVMPASITVNQESLTLSVGERARLTATTNPENALGTVLWLSSDAGVAQTTETGVITAAGPGTCEITALAFGGVRAICSIIVNEVAPESIAFAEEARVLPAGESVLLSYAVTPQYADDARVRFESSDERVAVVDAKGNATGIAEGQAIITITSAEGGLRDQMGLSVIPALPKRRALVMGEQRYLDGRIRVGSVNTTQGMADLLRSQSFFGHGYQVSMKMDSTREEALAHIREAFKDALPGDISLFYINCHGKFLNGRAFLEFFDGSTLSARALETELRKIPGKVIVLIDCCNSGGFIRESQAEAFSNQLAHPFLSGRPGSFSVNKYVVMCSSGATQDSYRIGETGDAKDETSMATLFARGLCEAGGWDLINDRKISLRADADKDRIVTFSEAYQYARRRVKYYLRDSEAEQDVQLYPKGSRLALFMR